MKRVSGASYDVECSSSPSLKINHHLKTLDWSFVWMPSREETRRNWKHHTHCLFVFLCFLFFSWSCRGLWWPLIWSKPQLVETFSAGTLFWQWVALYVQRTDTGAIVIINGDECQTICVVFFFFCVRLPCFNLLYRASYHAKKHPLHLTGFGPQHNHYAWPRALQKVIHSCDSRCWLSLGCYE